MAAIKVVTLASTIVRNALANPASIAARTVLPAQLAEELMLLVEGAISLAHVAGRKSAARRAQTVARRLIDDALAGAAA